MRRRGIKRSVTAYHLGAKLGYVFVELDCGHEKQATQGRADRVWGNVFQIVRQKYAFCAKCKGEGRLLRQRTVDAKIPAGVEDGTRIRFAGAGEVGQFGGPAGDLYVVLHVKEHPFFEREGNDLHCVVPISVAQAAMGAEIRVPTMEGEHTMKVPDGTQPGTTFRIRNKGVPVLNGHGKGDLYVEVRVQIPGKLNKRQKELLQELDGLSKIDNQPLLRSLIGKVKDIFQ